MRYSFLFLSITLLEILPFTSPPAHGQRLEGVSQYGPKVARLTSDKMGPYVNLPDGSVLAVHENATIVSNDDGKTWSEPRPIFTPGQNHRLRDERALMRTRDGVLILAFLDENSRKWEWNEHSLETLQANRLNVMTIRSHDDGKTWTDLQLVQRGYCGAVRDLMETNDGSIILGSQLLIPELARHAVLTYRSKDQGKTWERSNLLDLRGSAGHHAGCCEATIYQRKTGDLCMIMRTNRRVFWEAASADGLEWSNFHKTEISAASAPALVKRLASGRLVMVWNLAQGNPQTDRTQIVFAFSEDDGETWTKPSLLAQGHRLAYPYILERHPGELWITTMYGQIRAKVLEADFFPMASE